MTPGYTEFEDTQPHEDKAVEPDIDGIVRRLLMHACLIPREKYVPVLRDEIHAIIESWTDQRRRLAEFGTMAADRDEAIRQHRQILEAYQERLADFSDMANSMIDKTLDECVAIAREGCLVPPDGGSPTDDERRVADHIAGMISRLKSKASLSKPQQWWTYEGCQNAKDL